MALFGTGAVALTAFSSEADTGSPKKTRQNKRLELRSDSIRTDKALRHGDWSTSRRGGRLRRDALIQFLIDDLDRTVDFGIGCAELMRNQLHQEVDAFDGRRATSDRPSRRRGLEKAFSRFGVFLERYLIGGIGAETLGDGIDMVIDRLREVDIAVYRVADRLRLLRRDAAVIPGQQHRPFG